MGEALGTFLLVLFGTGAVATAVLTEALQGLGQVAVVWAVGVAVAIYATAHLSGAHLNPAVSLAFALWRRDAFPSIRLLPYWAAQMAGAFLAGLIVLLSFGPLLERFELREGLVRGGPGSERAAMVFGQYFPNPALSSASSQSVDWLSPGAAATIEALGTAILVLVIFAVTDARNRAAPPATLTPLVIGATVGALICVFAPLTQAGWNPARDLGPRLVAWMAGYGAVALPGPQAGFWVYLVGPLIGAALGGGLYEWGLRPTRPAAELFDGRVRSPTCPHPAAPSEPGPVRGDDSSQR